MTCSTPGCDRPIKGHGLCSTHHRAALRNGTIVPRRVANQDLCPIDGCDRTVRTKGLCQRHYRQQWDAARKATNPRPARKKAPVTTTTTPRPAARKAASPPARTRKAATTSMPPATTTPRPAPRRTSRGDMAGITDIIVLSRPHDRATLDRARRCLQRHEALDLAAMLGLDGAA